MAFILYVEPQFPQVISLIMYTLAPYAVFFNTRIKYPLMTHDARTAIQEEICAVADSFIGEERRILNIRWRNVLPNVKRMIRKDVQDCINDTGKKRLRMKNMHTHISTFRS